ncbi:unnamed protein product [Vitrella brassicaformis CCMP3155]|uniref:Uncharacterized protein n=1 Tax=Vitrella brassicaformis (strain CCMP3155) TaxID=1169540 RepID=A0A0G4GAN2_VITBC|nr:unnamed protein product [Vitrella brassicaformis CCMP3155]|eukprot:CEM26039.1 unnamed protein product [Vitrella brassicaformis CCMP3155]
MHIAKLKEYNGIIVGFDLICWATITPMGVFWVASQKSKRRAIYTAQMVFILLVTMAAVSVWVLVFFKRGEKVSTDGERAQVAFACLLCCLPLMALATGTTRRMTDGHPLRSYPVIYFAVLGCLLVPRIMQAEMVNLSSKIASSLLFALYDLLGDLAVPYVDALRFNLRRSFAFLRRSSTRHRSTRRTPETPAGSTTEKPHMDSTRVPPHVSQSRSSTCVASKEEASVSPSFQRRISLKALSSLTSVLNLQSTFIAYDYRPRYLRALSDQIHAYNLAESLILLFINLSLIAVDQFVDPSLSGLAERLGGLCLLVAIEMACEIVLFMISVRLHNLPIVRSEDEPGPWRSGWCLCSAPPWLCYSHFCHRSCCSP